MQKQQIGKGNSISEPAMFAAPPDLTTISQLVRARSPTWPRVETERDQRPLHVLGSAFWCVSLHVPVSTCYQPLRRLTGCPRGFLVPVQPSPRTYRRGSRGCGHVIKDKLKETIEGEMWFKGFSKFHIAMWLNCVLSLINESLGGHTDEWLRVFEKCQSATGRRQ